MVIVFVYRIISIDFYKFGGTYLYPKLAYGEYILIIIIIEV